MRFLFQVLVVVAVGWLISSLAAAIDRFDERYLSHPEVIQREFSRRVSAAAKPPAVPAIRGAHVK